MEKGPYLKMYSTYIKEFDKNICLLDEQCKKNSTFAAVVREFEVINILKTDIAFNNLLPRVCLGQTHRV